jgi:hypothetical protein
MRNRFSEEDRLIIKQIVTEAVAECNDRSLKSHMAVFGIDGKNGISTVEHEVRLDEGDKRWFRLVAIAGALQVLTGAASFFVGKFIRL